VFDGCSSNDFGDSCKTGFTPRAPRSTYALDDVTPIDLESEGTQSNNVLQTGEVQSHSMAINMKARQASGRILDYDP
jgi:hypothetical protein